MQLMGIVFIVGVTLSMTAMFFIAVDSARVLQPVRVAIATLTSRKIKNQREVIMNWLGSIWENFAGLFRKNPPEIELLTKDNWEGYRGSHRYYPPPQRSRKPLLVIGLVIAVLGAYTFAVVSFARTDQEVNPSGHGSAMVLHDFPESGSQTPPEEKKKGGFSIPIVTPVFEFIGGIFGAVGTFIGGMFSAIGTGVSILLWGLFFVIVGIVLRAIVLMRSALAEAKSHRVGPWAIFKIKAKQDWAYISPTLSDQDVQDQYPWYFRQKQQSGQPSSNSSKRRGRSRRR